MQTVSQLQQQDPDVLGHGKQHLPDILRLIGKSAVKLKIINLRSPAHQGGNIFTKEFSEFIFSRPGRRL